ncbi:uncharacterized protein LOC143245606 [Tachypleus tridentatus]|uniref:uncharacterized protein LOC143245606 n=1 Tax=Tachypleus tridentatus TaxID=6853 RepID=UPI003FCF643B
MIGLTVLIVILTAMTARPAETKEVKDNTSLKLAEVSNKFALDLYKQLAKDENIFISPLSISTAMGMVYLGAKQKTAEEMEEILGYKNKQLSNDEVHQGFQNILSLIDETKKEYELISANSMFCQINYTILDSYKKSLEGKYKAELIETDFIRAGEEAVNEINSWVKDKTFNKIKQLFDSPLSTDTRLVLLNAIYFQGAWISEFNPNETSTGTFYNNGKEETHIPLMHKKSKFAFAYIQHLHANVLELPYKGKDIGMFVILPIKKDGLWNLEQQLTSSSFTEIIDQLKEVKVDVILPKFKLIDERDLVPSLRQLGVNRLFTPHQSNLSGINGEQGLFVSGIKHKAVIEVNEEGSEAAAVTGVEISTLSLGPMFHANHPFFFFIRDKRTGFNIFLGRVNELYTKMQQLRLVLLIWALVTITAATEEWIGVTSTVTHNLANAINKFGLHLFMQLPKNENILISPLSISTALGMVYLGAKNKTAQEMEVVLGYNDEQLSNGDIHKSFQNILHTIERSKEEYELIIADSMFYQSNSLIRNCYKRNLEEKYKAQIKETDFAGDEEKSVNEINSWVDKSTHHKIKQLFESPLSRNTRLVLVNAVYFQGTWVSKFFLKEGTFYNNGHNPKVVPLMYLRHEFPFAHIEELEAKIIELPYNGRDFSMFIVLPITKDGILNLERRLNPKILEQAIENLTETEVDVTLPKFILSYKKDLSDTLKSLGLVSLFSKEKADLSGINGGRDMFVSHVKHHATIEVNEKGSTASAATGVGIVGFTYHPNFYAHHPFFFFIKDKRTGIILFTGRVNKL